MTSRVHHRPTLPPPPPGSGITVEEGEEGPRIVLPRRYTRVDLVLTGVFAAVAVWMAVWVREAATPDATASSLALAVMAGIGLIFGVLAASQAFAILAPRVIEGRGDRVVLGRKVGIRHIPQRRLHVSRIDAVERFWEDGDPAGGAPGVVRIRAGGHVHTLGKHLGADAVSWLEDAVRALAGRA